MRYLPFGNHTKNDGTSPSLMGKSTNSMGHVQVRKRLSESSGERSRTEGAVRSDWGIHISYEQWGAAWSYFPSFRVSQPSNSTI